MKLPVIAFDGRFINDRYHGIGRHAYNLLEALTRLDARHNYIVFYHPSYPNTRFNLVRLRSRINVELRPIRLPLYMPFEQLVWPLVLRKAGAVIFHSPYVLLPLLAPARLVMTVHDLIYESFPQYQPRSLLRFFYQTQTRLAVQRAAAVLTVSQATRLEIARHYRPPASKIHVIGNGVDPAFHAEIDPARLEAVRERYQLPPRFMLTLGSVRPHKNLEVVLDAMHLLEPSLAPTLVIAGEVDPRFPNVIPDRVRNQGLTNRVRSIGTVSEADLPTLFSLAHAFVFPSLVEGFGLPVLEAMACGTPVLAARVPGVSEAAGDAALSFDPRNPDELAARMRELLGNNDLRSKLSRLGLERARRFSWDRVAQATLEVYEAVVGEG
jgi:glycosyltransferase involved in cell wall biosynthesis